MKIGIVGATGVVGQEAWRLASEILADPKIEILPFASNARTSESGQKIFKLEDSQELLNSCEFVINAANADQAIWVAERLQKGQIMVDNSSAFRMNEMVPLIVPEVNGELLKDFNSNIVANPNCTAAILCVALNAIAHKGLKRIVVSTYQAASGAGLPGLEELKSQLRQWETPSEKWSTEVFGEALALNVLSHNSMARLDPELDAYLYNDEEYKVVEESKKILDLDDLWISATCVRVPVIRAHAESVTVDLESEATLQEIQEAFAKAPGIKIVDEPMKRSFPSPQKAQDQDDVLVGRIRQDLRHKKTWHFFIAGDQLRKGAATNALQIIKALRERG